MRTVYMVCGVPGSGKTWVCEQLRESIEHVDHDAYKDCLVEELLDREGVAPPPYLIDCPFGETKLRAELVTRGFDVRPYFIVEPTSVVKDRYYAREGKELGKAHVTRSKTIIDRAIEWKAPYGTSAEILELLKKEQKG